MLYAMLTRSHLALNCALGPDELRPVCRRACRVSLKHVPSLVHPNAGLPNAFGEYDLVSGRDGELTYQRVGGKRIPKLGGWLLWYYARTYSPDGRSSGLTIAKPRALPELPVACRLSGLRTADH